MTRATMAPAAHAPARAKPSASRKAKPAPARDPARDSAPDLPALRERALGNQSLMRMARPAPLSIRRKCSCGATCSKCSSGDDHIQTKLQVGDHDDAFEREADKVALRVLGVATAPTLAAGPDPFPAPRPATGSAAGTGAGAGPAGVQRASAGPVGPGASGPGAGARASAPMPGPSPDPAELTHGGMPMSPGLRAFFEHRFGRDLSEVRIHGGDASDAWNDRLHAHAFTYGSHIWLGRGHSPQADFLMAHELAHVVQQRQPRLLARAEAGRDMPEAGGAAVEAGRAGPSIQRLGLSDPFWIPLGGKGKLGGRDLHDELLTIAKNNNPKLDTEAPAPNADRKNWGVGYAGSIDIFQGDSMPGLTFDGPQVLGEQSPDPAKTFPKKHYRAAMTGPKASRFKPFVNDSGIHDIDKGPKDVRLGELKPAVSTMLAEGDTQLDNYAQGMSLAADLTNAWAKRNKKTDRWNLSKPTRLGAGDVKFIDGGTDLKFDKANPRDDFELVLGSVRESGTQGGKYVQGTDFIPAKHKLPPIKGGVYAQKFTGGAEGLWMYFARPKNLDEYLKTARVALDKGHEMRLANMVQDQVIDPMLKGPEKTAKLAKAGPPPILQRMAPPLPPLVQRAPKTPELKDDFKFADWAKKQRDLRKQISGPGAAEDTQKQIASMELLHKAYKADEALDKIPGTGKSSLPAKGTDMVNIVSGTGKKKPPPQKELSDLGGWLKGWTGKPAEILGFFRDKFGSAFVWVANKFISIKEWIQKKFHEHFQKKADVGGKTGKAKMILQALGKALKQVAKILLPRTLHLVMDAIEAGLKKKLAKVFDLDPEKMLDDAFGGEFTKLNQKLDDYKAKAEKYVKDIFDDYTKDMEWIKDLIDLAKEVGPIVEAGMALVQCASPPVWGCLKLLAKKLNDCAIAKVMNICSVQKEIADLTMKIKPIRDLPSTLAQKIMDTLKSVVPAGLEDVFSEPVAKPGDFNSGEIECEFTELPTGCPNWGLIGFEGGKGAPSKEDKDGKEGSGGKDKGSSDGQNDPDPKDSGKQPDAGKTPPPNTGKTPPDAGNPPPPNVGKAPPPNTGSPQPDAKEPQPPAPQGQSPKADQPPKDEGTQKMEDFLDKLTKEELDELYKEAERQKMLDQPFDPKKAEEMLDQVRKSLKAKKEAEAKKKAEAKRKAAEEKKKKEAEEKGAGPKDQGSAGQPGAGPGSGPPGKCTWDPSLLSVGGFLMRGMEEDILDEGHTHTQPFADKTILGCGGIPLVFKYDFQIAAVGCERDWAFAKPVVSLEIRFKTATADQLLFKKTEGNPTMFEVFVEPGWGAGSRINLGTLNANGTLEIKVAMTDPDTGTVRTITGKIPIDVNCT